MKYGKLKEVDGEFVRSAVEWLLDEQTGCSSICFATDSKYDYAVCVGWHQAGPERIANGDGTFRNAPGDDGWRVAWKIGRQTPNNVMQCDFDIDFEMPYSLESGDVDDTVEVIEVKDGKPVGYKSWNELATTMRKTARRVWKDWREP